MSRVLHLNDRLSQRGGADWYLLGVLEQSNRSHYVQLAVGYRDATASVSCPLTVLPGLASRTGEPVELEPLLERFAPDLIHLHNIMNPWVLEWASGRRALMTVQDHRVFCPYRGKWKASGEVCAEPMSRRLCKNCFDDEDYFEHIFSLTSRRLEAIKRLPLTVLSAYMKRELQAVGVPAARIEVIPPFVHGLDPKARPDGPPCVLWLGRLVDTKGVEDAIRAWRLSGLQAPLVIAGTGSRRAQLEQRYPEVYFLGWVDHDQLPSLYRRAEVVLMTSRWQEPFGIVGLEALSMGVPVVAWESGGIPEWHPGGPGLVPWGDVHALARSLRDLAGSNLGEIQGFEPESLMARLDDLYQRLLGSS